MSQFDTKQLVWAVEELAQRHGMATDPLSLQATVRRFGGNGGIKNLASLLDELAESQGFAKVQALPALDAAYLPLLCYTQAHGWAVVLHLESNGLWRVLTPQGELHLAESVFSDHMYLFKPHSKLGLVFEQQESFKSHALGVLSKWRPELLEAGLTSLLIGLLALATSLFSMQVYDRVIPTQGQYTLVILSLGVVLSILIELAMKMARSKLMDYVVVGADNRLSREIFHRLLKLRVDQIPATVGSLAGQLRGYEMVRSFYTSNTMFTLIDFPLGILFLLIMAGIGTPWIALVPLLFGLLGVWVGLSARRKIRVQATEGSAYSNLKTGLLVETVEGAETVKAGSGGWKFLSRWLDVSALSIKNDLEMRAISEKTGYFSASIQQLSYASLIIVGALLVMQGHMTMGALIACSILSGRVLTPVLALPSLLVQHAHAQAALQGLEALYKLETDNHGIAHPLVPEALRGHFRFSGVKFAYDQGDKSPVALVVPSLDVQPGERVAVLGPIGSGKSTLLRLMSGMFLPQEGRILLDGLDLSHISRQLVSQKIGYLQQDHRLFLGTLRENLLIGMPDPGDDALRVAMEKTGMQAFVNKHPLGLERRIAEGGKGLSGGQRQLLAFTRMVLSNPEVWLLDEPTAHMDDEQERRCIKVLQEQAAAGKTLVIVTHKPKLLSLVSRVIIVAGSGIVMDGARDDVLQRLTKQPAGNA